MDSHLSKVPKSLDFIQSPKAIHQNRCFQQCNILSLDLQKVDFKQIKFQ